VAQAHFTLVTDLIRLQKIQYAKSKSDTIAKLDGTYHMPVVAAGAVTSTELQLSIFNAPPSSASGPAPPSSAAAGSLNPPDTATNGIQSDAEGLQGVKRRRDDESDAEDAPMEEDDSDAPMDASSDED